MALARRATLSRGVSRVDAWWAQSMIQSETTAALEAFEADHPDDFEVISAYMQYEFDAFMDVLGLYIEWSATTKSSRGYLDRLLRKWGLHGWIPEYQNAVLRRVVASAASRLAANDTATISLALAELVLRRKVSASLAKRASVCARRQANPVVLESRNYDDVNRAKQVLEGVRTVIIRRR